MSPVLDFDGVGFDLTLNARAPLQPWATDIQRRAHYEEYGRGPLGFDCMGLVSFVQNLIGRPAAEYSDLYRGVDLEDLEAIDALIRAESQSWRRAEGAPGDVLVLGHGGRAHHVAVLCGAGHALHVRAKKAVSIEELGLRRGVTRFSNLRLYGVVAPA